jgi:murein peptide amidase A
MARTTRGGQQLGIIRRRTVNLALVLCGGLLAASCGQSTDTSSDLMSPVESVDVTADREQNQDTEAGTKNQVDAPPAVQHLDDFAKADDIPFETSVEFGRSVLNTELTVVRRGNSGGARTLVIGNIHGDEQAGLRITSILRTMQIEESIDLWIIDTVNPDGTAVSTRKNANAVDLNRNFPHRWQPLGDVDSWQYSGPAPGSEPEVVSTMALVDFLQPTLIIWYHQDYFRISPASGREGKVRSRLAELIDLPLLPISGGVYSGTSTGWVRSHLDPSIISITVELGPSPLRQGEAEANANALMTIVNEFFR